MKIEYDRNVDALYITLAEAPVARTSEAGGGVQLDFDEAGRLIGVEVIGACGSRETEDKRVRPNENS